MKYSVLFAVLLLGILLLAAAVPPVSAGDPITSVSPNSGLNSGTVTLTIYGNNLKNATSIRLTKCRIQTGTPGGTTYGSIISRNQNSLTATFDLTWKNIGEYNLSANVPTPDYPEDWHVSGPIFYIYNATFPAWGGEPDVEDTTAPAAVATTTSASGEGGSGGNEVFFETNPSGAEVWLDGKDVGTSTFIYHTTDIGTHDVTIKKTGYEDYNAKVTILKDQRVRFYAPLDLQGSSPGETAVCTTTPKKTSLQGSVPTIPRSTLKIPTPLGTDPEPTTEDSPADPALALLAAAIGIGAVVIRRR